MQVWADKRRHYYWLDGHHMSREEEKYWAWVDAYALTRPWSLKWRTWSLS